VPPDAPRLTRSVTTRLAKDGFDPDEPRVPAGNPDGGQWTGEGDADGNIEPHARHALGPPLHDEGELQVADSQTCQDFIAENCKASILRVFPGEFLHVPVDEIYRRADEGDAAARRAKKLLSQPRFRKP
jgi:hypothetical protein